MIDILAYSARRTEAGKKWNVWKDHLFPHKQHFVHLKGDSWKIYKHDLFWLRGWGRMEVEDGGGGWQMFGFEDNQEVREITAEEVDTEPVSMATWYWNVDRVDGGFCGSPVLVFLWRRKYKILQLPLYRLPLSLCHFFQPFESKHFSAHLGYWYEDLRCIQDGKKIKYFW